MYYYYTGRKETWMCLYIAAIGLHKSSDIEPGVVGVGVVLPCCSPVEETLVSKQRSLKKLYTCTYSYILRMYWYISPFIPMATLIPHNVGLELLCIATAQCPHSSTPPSPTQVFLPDTPRFPSQICTMHFLLH